VSGRNEEKKGPEAGFAEKDLLERPQREKEHQRFPQKKGGIANKIGREGAGEMAGEKGRKGSLFWMPNSRAEIGYRTELLKQTCSMTKKKYKRGTKTDGKSQAGGH